MSSNHSSSKGTSTNSTAPQPPLENLANAQGASSLTQDETRQILTPFAFEIDKSLFGIALASPTRRAIALLIDMLVIVLLSDMPGELFAVVIAVSLYRIGGKKRARALGKVKGYKRRAFMRFIGAFILFVVLLDTLPTLFEQSSPSSFEQGNISSVTEYEDLSLEDGMVIMALTTDVFLGMSESDCQTKVCWQEALMPAIDKLLVLPELGVYDVIESIVEETHLIPQEQDELKLSFINRYKMLKTEINQDEATKPEKPEITDLTNPVADENKEPNDVTVIADDLPQTQTTKEVEASKDEKTVYSIVEWVKGIMNDLGLGFGWAAFYFTAFTALWHGQTLGKKLLSIRVLQLDGTPLSLWDSFGRYGGYGAGIATGMLGFLQIFWDPNRQAIHDKISTTVVVNTKKIKT